jgi:hypothetical protein
MNPVVAGWIKIPILWFKCLHGMDRDIRDGMYMLKYKKA